MLDREPRERDPNAKREPETVVRPNRRARHGPCRLASRAGTAHSRPSGAGIRGIPVDVHFGPGAPAGKESNWAPTDPPRGFELMFRVYGPKKEFFEKAWVLPDAEKVAAE